jgi:hypothetical protein
MDQYIQDERNVYILNVSQFHRFYIHLNKLHIYHQWISIYLFFDRSSLVYVQYHCRIDQRKVVHHGQVNRIDPRKNQINSIDSNEELTPNWIWRAVGTPRTSGLCIIHAKAKRSIGAKGEWSSPPSSSSSNDGLCPPKKLLEEKSFHSKETFIEIRTEGNELEEKPDDEVALT